MIRWFAHNPVAANLLMVAILVAGLFAIRTQIPLEVFPAIEFNAVNVTTVLPGASPEDVEEGITIRIEEAVHDLEGVKKLSSRSGEGFSTVTIQAENDYDPRTLLNEVKLRVDAIDNLPADAERPIIELGEILLEVMSVVISGDVTRKQLLPFAERLRDDLLQLDGVSKVRFLDKPDLEISIEIAPDTLKALNLTMQDVAVAIDTQSVELSAGNIKNRDGEILIRTDGRAYTAQEFARLPIVTTNAGNVILLGDIAEIRDGFEDINLVTLFDGEPSMSLDVFRSGNESAVAVSEVVRDYIAEARPSLPEGIHLNYWRDNSVIVESRLKTLTNSAIQGGILVMLLLTLFLRPAVAFWVCLGIPVCFMGAIALMPHMGVTFNMISLFGFILVLGIVVDDAIVTGENIFRHLRSGKDSLTAAIDGTREVAVPVTFGVLTTVVAFAPLLLVDGAAGKLFRNIPLIAIPVLLFSLVESKLILPAHMRHIQTREQDENTGRLSRWQQNFSLGFEKAILRFYQPALRTCLKNKAITIIGTLVLAGLVFSLAAFNWIRFDFFPQVDDEAILAQLTMSPTTGFAATNRQIEHMVATARELQEEYRDPNTGESVIEYIISFAGVTLTGGLKNNSGLVAFEVQAPEDRGDVEISEIAERWREKIGDIPGAEKLSIQAKIADAGRPLEIQFTGDNIEQMDQFAQRLREHWRQYPEVFDIQDSHADGKEEYQLSLKPEAYNLGISQQAIALQVRQAIYGLEAQRLQRERDEISVMLRYPPESRSSLEDLSNLPISNGRSTIPLSDLATITPGRSPSAYYRVDRRRTLTISADVDKKNADVEALKRETREFVDALLVNQPDIDYTMEGEAKEQADAFGSLGLGMAAVLMAIYALLAIPFKSYSQPMIVMSVIPLGLAGAIVGHLIMQTNLSLLSLMGMLALTGVVVNDSLVLVDYINKQRRKGMEVLQAVLTAGAARFRPVMLTSLTTFAGLTPLLMEKSTQAQFLIPMAISLGFGILFATAITLVIIPVIYVIGDDMSKLRPTGVWWVSLMLFGILAINAGLLGGAYENQYDLLLENLLTTGLLLIQLAALLLAAILLIARNQLTLPLLSALVVVSIVCSVFYLRNDIATEWIAIFVTGQPVLVVLFAYYASELKKRGYFSPGKQWQAGAASIEPAQ